MKEYLKLVKTILKKGSLKNNRTGTDTISYFGLQSRYDLAKGFPLLTTKKVYFKGIIHELLWFLKGDTNIEYLVKNNVKIWNEWAFENFKKSSIYKNETLNEFVLKIKNDHGFAKEYGNLGPIYGKQWRSFNNIDQIKYISDELRRNKNSRRLIVSAWNPCDIPNMALPPCHTMFQLYVTGNKLSLHLYQRSADVFLGVPFNIASYSLLLLMFCKTFDFEPGEFIHSIGDGHIYINHLQQIKTQLKRKPKKLPTLNINTKHDDLSQYTFEDFELKNYKCHPAIKGEVAV